MAMLARKFIKVNRYDFYYSRVKGIAENLNGKHNFSEREDAIVEGWTSWSYASNKAIVKFSMLLKRAELETTELPHINSSWKERFYYIVNLLRRDSIKINKKRVINRIANFLNNFSFFKSQRDSSRKLFSHSSYLESSKLNTYNRELNTRENQEIYTKWSQAVKLNCNIMNKPFLLNPVRELSAWDHCYHRSEIDLKTFVSDSWQKTFRNCWNSIERLSQRWNKRLRDCDEISDFEN